MSVVVLDAAEMLLAANAGVMRHIENVKERSKASIWGWHS